MKGLSIWTFLKISKTWQTMCQAFSFGIFEGKEEEIEELEGY